MTKNYAKFRRELQELCPWLGEQEIYKNWRTLVHGKDSTWQVQQEPVKTKFGFYHFVYITIVPSIGKIYVGRHSTLDLADGYHGSGVKVKELEAQGVELVTIPLEFFRSYELSLGAEAEIVDRAFLIEPEVLNQTTSFCGAIFCGDAIWRLCGSSSDEAPQLPKGCGSSKENHAPSGQERFDTKEQPQFLLVRGTWAEGWRQTRICPRPNHLRRGRGFRQKGQVQGQVLDAHYSNVEVAWNQVREGVPATQLLALEWEAPHRD